MNLTKVKNYGICALAVFLLVSVYFQKVERNKRIKWEADYKRLWENYVQIQESNRKSLSLVYSQKEFLNVLNDSLKKELHNLKINPKTVTKIVEKEVIVRDTVKEKVPVYITGPDQWHIKDSDKCWLWEADAYLWNQDLVIDRTKFEYTNKTTDVYHRKLKFKFLGLKFYSKKEIVQTSTSECGESKTTEINILK